MATNRKQSDRQYRGTHREALRETGRVFVKQFMDNNPERWKEIHRKASRTYSAKTKLTVLTHYSPNHQLGCSWAGCDISDIDMLVLDHINDNGAEERKQIGRGHQFYKRLLLQSYPEGYQTLCCNHNQKKELLRRRQILSISQEPN